MKKILLYILGIVAISFLIPIFFTNVKIQEVITNTAELPSEQQEVIQNNYEYSNYNKIK